jgi:hypothetical protein
MSTLNPNINTNLVQNNQIISIESGNLGVTNKNNELVNCDTRPLVPVSVLDFGIGEKLLDSELSKKVFVGIPNCSGCGGSGYLRATAKHGEMIPCMDCVKVSGHCPECNNTGYKIVRHAKKCKCPYGENI